MCQYKNQDIKGGIVSQSLFCYCDNSSVRCHQLHRCLNFLPGIGSEEVQPFSMSLEAEMMLEQLKEQHLQEMEDLRNQLESKVSLGDTFLYFIVFIKIMN